MVSLSNGGLSNGNSSENGHCSLPFGGGPPKYKPRKVSAVRDFPPGCGRNALLINSNSHEATNVAGVVDANGVRDFPPAHELNALQLNSRTQEATIMAGGEEANGVWDSPQGRGQNTPPINSSSQDAMIVAGADNMAGCAEANAFGDFPPACGQKPLPINSSSQESNIVEGGDGKTGAVEANGVKPAGNGVESTSNQVVESQVNQGIVVATPGMVHEVENLCTDAKAVGIEVPKELQNNGLESEKDSHKVQSMSAENRKPVLEIGALVDEGVPVGRAKSWSPPHCPINDASVEKGISPKNKYRQIRVSAVRDFPPFCGRNAPPLSKEDRLRIMPGRKKFGGTKRGGVESGAFVRTVRASVQSGALAETLSVTAQSETLGETQRDGVESGSLSDKVKAGVEELEREAQDGIPEKNELKGIVPQPRSKHQMVIEKDNEGIRGSVGKEIVVYSRDKGDKGTRLGDAVGLVSEVNRVIVQGLMAAPNCPWRQGKGSSSGLHGFRNKSMAKKSGFPGQEKHKPIARPTNYDTGGKSVREKSVFADKAAYGSVGALNIRYEEDNLVHNVEKHKDSPPGQTPHAFDVSLPPFGPNSSVHGDARNRVRETLRLFQAVCRKLLQGEEAKSRQQGKIVKEKGKDQSKRIDLQAAKIIKEKGKEVNTGKQIVGAVPGVEVGDEFQYRVELAIVGVHRLYQAGIDYVKHDGVIVATSIVASGAYADDMENADVLKYSGQGGNLIGPKQPEDQKLERGNLALKNSISAKNPVRVIRGYKETKVCDSFDAKAKIVTTYVYDGLYTVERYWTETGSHGKLVFMFELRRIPGQPELAWKEVKKSKKLKVREGVCVDDISGGKQLPSICAVNLIDEEKPPPFKYITRMKYPDWYRLIPPKGCDCSGRCSDSMKCLCAVKNGGEIPYNYNGAIVEAKPLVYECGPSCKCPPSCYNRVSQQGIKIPLEIFKTESRGWGVRSLTSIPSGSFICEYAGELLDDKEAEQRTGNDEYLFDIGQNYNDCSLRPDGQSSSNEVEDGGYTIDAAQYGNVGRFINHSCSPNLYAQNVLFDHEDKRMPHIMLFSAENIPPLQELTYHYNYSVDEVRDSNGNIKMKSCFCGSTECTGRMY